MQKLVISSLLCTTTLLADTYTWVGGMGALDSLPPNDMNSMNNWIPSTGPPGTNDLCIFSTAANPPVCEASDSLQVEMEFEVPSVIVTVFGTLTSIGVQNDNNVTSTFNIENGGAFQQFQGISGGTSNYNVINGSTLEIAYAGTSSANAYLSGGSSFTIDLGFPTTIISLSSSSASDMILLNDNLTLTAANNQTIAGAVSGTGSLTIAGGALVLNNTVANPVIVNSGATLQGIGTLFGGATIFGTISPGNSPGAMTLTTLALEAGSVTNIEINPTESSQLVITGSATLNGTVNVTQDGGTYPPSGQYTILTGIYTGGFNPTVTGGGNAFRFSLIQVPGFIYLDYTNYGISTDNLSGNALTLANYLNNYASLSALELVSVLSGNTLKSALNNISPSRNAFVPYITQQTAFSLSADLTNHIDNIDPCSCNEYSFWISGFGEYAHQRAKNQNPSFNAISEAILLGFDHYFEDRDLVGFALGYAHTRFNESDHAGHGNVNYYFGSVYENGTVGNFYLSPAIWGIFDETENTRHISFPGFSKNAKANIFAWQIVPHLEIGYDFDFCWGEIVPFTALDWAITWQRAYHEHGAAPFNARSTGKTSSMARSETGLKFSEKWEYCWGSFFLKEKVSYVFQKPYNTGKVNTSFTGIPSTFTVTAVNQNLNLADIGIDLSLELGRNNRATIDLAYEGEFGSNYISNQLMLTLKKDF